LRRQEEESGVIKPPEKRGRGRPKGSKNKNPKGSASDLSVLNIRSLLRRAYGSEPTTTTAVIDDDKLPLAPNFYTFATNNTWMGPLALDVKLWSRQLEIGTRLFGEWCPRCTDKTWMPAAFKGRLTVPLDATPKQFEKHITLLEHGKCPKCGLTHTEGTRKHLIPSYDSMIGIAGQRSAKTFTVALVATYLTHWLLKQRNPAKTYGVARGTELQGVFVATTAQQAMETLWMFYSNFIRQSAWFTAYHRLLDKESAKLGQPLYKQMDTFIHYRHKGLLFYPSGPNVRTTRGRTRIFSAIDEICYFLNDGSDSIRLDATKVLKALENSLLTVRSAVNRVVRDTKYRLPRLPITALSCNISSPVSVRDKGMMLLRESKVVPSLMGFQHATWQLNPTIKKKDIKEFKTDPVLAETDFGANPPLSNNAFFIKGVLPAFSKMGAKNAVVTINRSGQKQMRACSWATLQRTRSIGQPLVLAIDAGHVNNSFAFALARPTAGTKMKVCVEAVGAVIPKPGYPVDFSILYKKFLAVLCSSFTVRAAFADRWQSIKILDDLRTDVEGLTAEMYSLKYRDMVLVRDNMMDGLIRLPRLEMPIEQVLDSVTVEHPLAAKAPVSMLGLQMATVVDTGKKVIKSDDLSDDLWRATALAVYKCLDPNIIALLGTGSETESKTALGSVALKSSGSASGASLASGSSGMALGLVRRRGGG
jgi:hypothetical protein